MERPRGEPAEYRWPRVAGLPDHPTVALPTDSRCGLSGVAIWPALAFVEGVGDGRRVARASNRKVFATFADKDGMPDGLTVDADGCLWRAHWAGSQISRWSPAGERLLGLDVPSVHVTSLAFGGSDQRTLYNTTPAMELAKSPGSGSCCPAHCLPVSPDREALPKLCFPIQPIRFRTAVRDRAYSVQFFHDRE